MSDRLPPPLPDEPTPDPSGPPPLPDDRRPGPTDGAPAPPPLPGGNGTGAPEPAVDGIGDVDDPDAPDGPATALHHVTESTRTYPCQACGGELHFDIELQRLRCQHCGTTHELAEIDRIVEERDLATALALVRQGRVAHSTTFLPGEQEVVCQNCGGHTTFTGSLTADRCPYCATPIQLDDVHDAPERLPVDGVLPFRISDDRAAELIAAWIRSRWFAPSEFEKYHRTGAFSSVYTAYFTYDAETVARYRGQRGDHYTVTVGHGKNRRVETRVRWRSVSGTVADRFDDVPVFANQGFDRDRIAELEPWPTDSAEPYSAEYVAGHLCRTYDHDVEECLPSATRRMQQAVEQHVRRDIGGDQQRITSLDIDWRAMTYKHLLLPIWLLTVIYRQQPYQVYINGVTGEVHGERPYSTAKIALAVAAAAVLVVVVAVLFARQGGSG